MWCYILRAFTPSDLAGAMAVTVESVGGFLIGLQNYGTIEDTGDRINGHGGEPEPLFMVAPLPEDSPRWHPRTMPPELTVPGAYSLAPRRGRPISGTGMSETQERRWRSITGRKRRGRA